MTQVGQARAASLRLYQANYRLIGSPVLVVAATSDDAVAVARTHGPNGSDGRSILAVDVTEQFLELSGEAREQTRALLSEGKTGIVEYDDEEGWLLREA